MISKKNILPLLMLLILSTTVHAEIERRQDREYLLGGGGTNYSNRKPDKNGLLTGTYSYDHYLFGMYAFGGYSGHLSTVPFESFKPGGVGFGIGLCFEYQYYYFKLNLGAGAALQHVTNTLNDTTFFNNNVYDARGYNYQLQYDFYKRQDVAISYHGQVHLLAGMGYNHFYFLAGFKVNHTFHGSTRVDMFGTTSGRYEQYLGYFVEMDNHGLRKNVPVERKGPKLELKLDIIASFEIGTEWGNDMPHRSKYRPANGGQSKLEYRWRIAAFIDYGLLNIMPKTSKDYVYIPESYKWDFPEYQASHIFSTQDAAKYALHNLYAGVKLTILIGWYVDYKCRLCKPHDTERTMSNPYVKKRRSYRTGSGR